jgi:predicted Holliday junction resolvase-like endonuclease
MYLEICFLLLLCAVSFFYSYRLKIACDALKKQNAKILSQKKSSEVKTGHIAEKFAPFLGNFKHDPSRCVFLGQPIDYLCFEDEGITFCEVKSGQSKLSNKQKMIRDHIISGNVFWEEFRVD